MKQQVKIYHGFFIQAFKIALLVQLQFFFCFNKLCFIPTFCLDKLSVKGQSSAANLHCSTIHV